MLFSLVGLIPVPTRQLPNWQRRLQRAPSHMDRSNSEESNHNLIPIFQVRRYRLSLALISRIYLFATKTDSTIRSDMWVIKVDRLDKKYQTKKPEFFLWAILAELYVAILLRSPGRNNMLSICRLSFVYLIVACNVPVLWQNYWSYDRGVFTVK